MRLNWREFVQVEWTKIQEVVFPSVAALTWTDQLVKPQQGPTVFEQYDVHPWLASGCILDIGGHWFFLTAGHVLTGIRATRDRGRKIRRFSLLAGFRQRGGRTDEFPLPCDPREFIIWEHEASGLDYGLIAIPAEACATLLANGVRSVAEDMVARVDEQFDGYALIGFPYQETRLSTKDSATRRDIEAGIGAVTLPVEPLGGNAVPDNYRCLSGNLLVGKIVSMRGQYESRKEAVELSCIKGMSGGPIFGLRLDGPSLEFRLAAVQSSWIPNQRIIGGSRVWYLTTAMRQKLMAQETSARPNAP